MVVPLKLTQFYGHRVPRPRIYPDVKFNDQRVDPPPSVNEALLSWASEAHWSMGGLSFKRLRTQGKVEGNVRRLRAFVEDDSEEDGPEMTKRPVKETRKHIDAAENVKCSTKRGTSRSLEPRKKGEEEMVEVTPAPKLRRRGVVEESDEELPMCVPATEERSQRSGQKVKRSLNGRNSSDDGPQKGVILETPSVVPATGEKREGKLANLRSLRGSNGPNSATRRIPEGSDGGRLTRSAKKLPAAQNSSPQQPSKVSRARKVLMASDSESSESDDGLEEFLKEKSRPLRRSTRLVKTEGKSSESGSESD